MPKLQKKRRRNDRDYFLSTSFTDGSVRHVMEACTFACSHSHRTQCAVSSVRFEASNRRTAIVVHIWVMCPIQDIHISKVGLSVFVLFIHDQHIEWALLSSPSTRLVYESSTFCAGYSFLPRFYFLLRKWKKKPKNNNNEEPLSRSDVSIAQ